MRGRAESGRSADVREFLGRQIHAHLKPRRRRWAAGRLALRERSAVRLALAHAAEEQVSNFAETSGCRVRFRHFRSSSLTTNNRQLPDQSTSTILFSSPNWLASTYWLLGSVIHLPSTTRR